MEELWESFFYVGDKLLIDIYGRLYTTNFILKSVCSYRKYIYILQRILNIIFKDSLDTHNKIHTDKNT